MIGAKKTVAFLCMRTSLYRLLLTTLLPPSCEDRCGKTQNWLWPVFMEPEDYYTFAEPPRPPHPAPVNYAYLEAIPRVPGFDIVDGQYVKTDDP